MGFRPARRAQEENVTSKVALAAHGRQGAQGCHSPESLFGLRQGEEDARLMSILCAEYVLPSNCGRSSEGRLLIRIEFVDIKDLWAGRITRGHHTSSDPASSHPTTTSRNETLNTAQTTNAITTQPSTAVETDHAPPASPRKETRGAAVTTSKATASTTPSRAR